MSEKKHIDRLFQEKFKDFESQPPTSVWDGIQAGLATPNKKDRKVIPIWWRVAGVAALLALLFTAVTFWGPDSTSTDLVDTDTNEIENTLDANDAIINSEIKSNESTQDAIVNASENEDSNKNESDNKNPVDLNTNSNNTKAVVKSDNTNKQNKTTYFVNKNSVDAIIKEDSKTSDAVVDVQNQTKNTDGTLTVDEQNTSKNNDAVINKEAINNALENTTSDAVITDANKVETQTDTKDESEEAQVGKIDINEYIANKEEEALVENQVDQQEFDGKRWSVSPQVAPVYYGSLNNGSSISAEFADNAKTSETNFSYGVQVSYNVNDRFSIRSGVNKVNLSYNTNDIEFAVTPSDVALGGTKFVTGNISYTVGDKGTLQDRFAAAAVPTTEDAVPATIDAFQGQLNHRMEYWEVPVEMSYALINKRFRLNLLGGFSSLILQDNQLVAKSGAREASLGSAENLNSFSFTTNVGLGLNYSITDQFRISMEPMFKYQLNPYTDASIDFKPYYMGVYTGLSFRF